MAAYVRGGERYRLYSVADDRGISEGSGVRVDAPGNTRFVDLTPSPNTDIDALAVCTDWNALPRKPKIQSTAQKVYQDAVRDVLNRNGIPGARVNITQLIRVDLEGDGREEVLLSATTPRDGYPQPDSHSGDYSVVILRKIVDGNVSTQILEGEFYPNPVSFNAPNLYAVSAILDLDGDGAMEVAVSHRHYEGFGMDIFAMRGPRAVRVLTGGMGA